MWKCECGEFNNEELEFCVKCERVRLTEAVAEPQKKKQVSTRAMFRRVQDFILLDIAFCAMVALYCLIVDDVVTILPAQQFATAVPEVAKTTLPIIVIVLFQVLLAINILRMLYGTALSSERNNLFLQRIYKMLKEKDDEGKKGGSA